MKWMIILTFFLIGCGDGNKASNTDSVAQGNLGLNVSVPNFESNTGQQKGKILIPHTPESGSVIQFEGKNYFVDNIKSSTSALLLIRKLFRNQVDVRPFDQNDNGTYYSIRFNGKLNDDSVILQNLYVY